MNQMVKIMLSASIIGASCLAAADTLELADGSLLEGDFVGSSNGIIMFDTGAGIEAFPEDKVVGVFFSEGVKTAESERADKANNVIVVPAGTRLVIRTSDTVDSQKHGAGHRFRGQLESALVVKGKTVVPRGAIIHGQVINAKSSGRVAGSAEMAIEFTDIMIDDQLYPITTRGLQAQSGNEVGRTAGRTARAAAIGGLMNGKSGARTGAKVGVGASILAGGTSLLLPAGSIVETEIAADFKVD